MIFHVLFFCFHMQHFLCFFGLSILLLLFKLFLIYVENGNFFRTTHLALPRNFLWFSLFSVVKLLGVLEA